MMTVKALNLIPSGIEPIDRLAGGLESGQLYLAHGEAAGKSLFGIKFLIEGLKRGENSALVIRYSAEDAVRRFARLGYDCLTDVQQGRLVILEYSEDIINQIQKLAELGPVLRELEWLLKDAHPQRLIFDPVTQLISGEKGELRPKVSEFTNWASSFGATVLLVANGNGKAVIQELQPFVRESFKFDFKEVDGRATRFFTFEKSPTIAEQAVEVDPSRGVFLLEKTLAPAVKLAGDKASPTVSDRKSARGSTGAGIAGTATSANPLIEPLIIEPQSPLQPQPALARPKREPLQEILNQLSEEQKTTAPGQTLPAHHTTEFGRTDKFTANELSDFLKALDSAIAAIDVNFVESSSQGLPNTGLAQTAKIPAEVSTAQLPNDIQTLISQANPENAVGYSKRAGDALYTDDRAAGWATINSLTVAGTEAAPINAKDFHIVVIDEDDLSCRRVAKALEEYTVLSAQDTVRGIANLMASHADLIILDIDMSIADGFKVLSHIRSSTSAPIIVLSKTHIRSADRIFSSELGADYYLTKPFSAKELKQKAKQLIARYKGIDSWIITPGPASASAPKLSIDDLQPAVERRAGFSGEVVKLKTEHLAVYPQFIEQVEANVKRSMERSTAFSIVGYKLENLSQNAAQRLKELADLLGPAVRNADIVSINDEQELVILLHDTNSIGARAFISRARRRLPDTLSQQLSIWMRSFPNLEEEFESAYAS